jgi:DNA-binding NarL/FixJ family response regulator
VKLGEFMPEDEILPKTITIAVVDDDVNVRTGLWWLLSNIAGIHCTGTYADFCEAMQGLTLQAPDIVLLDVTMPGVSGIDAIRPIHKQSPHVRIIMHSNYDDEEKIFQAQQAGAAGYILKNASAPALYEAILKVYQGGSVWPTGYEEADLEPLSHNDFIGRVAARARTLLKGVRSR